MRGLFKMGQSLKPWSNYEACSDAFGSLVVSGDSIWKPVSKSFESLFGFEISISSLRRYLSPSKEGGKAPSARIDNILSSKALLLVNDSYMRRDTILKHNRGNIQGWLTLLENNFIAEAYGALQGSIMLPKPSSPSPTPSTFEADQGSASLEVIQVRTYTYLLVPCLFIF